MSEQPRASAAEPARPDIGSLLALIRSLVGELHPQWKNLRFQPDTHLERELGLDSMARLELQVRIRRSFGITLDEATAIRALTANDLLRGMINQQRNPGSGEIALPQGTNLPGQASDLLMGPFGILDKAQTAAGDARRTAGEWLYAGYAWVIFLALFALVWVLLMITPFSSWRRRIAHLGARLFLFCSFTPFRVSGREYLTRDKPQILVVNHASYLDGFIVTAALDVPIHFIVKAELAARPVARLLLERLGVEFVDRFNSHHGASAVQRIAEKSRNGQSIVFFPEGTFTSFPGLQPFRMGAFVTAVQSQTPVVPVAIKGSRTIVRGSDWFPHHGAIEVTVCPPVMPHGTGWEAAVELRDAARREITRHSGEPDLVALSGDGG
ncbi:MAG: 1-acyl-sn-glycerol-3-phosphate acyltransferase [Gammaproteobacteria bacterium]|jgi:1-acyl-sn-glycerol-3-phosphate acyltransferase